MSKQGREVRFTYSHFAAVAVIAIAATLVGSSSGAFAEEPILAAKPSTSATYSTAPAATQEMAMTDPQPEVLHEHVRNFDSKITAPTREQIGFSKPGATQLFGGRPRPSGFEYQGRDFWPTPHLNPEASLTSSSTDIRKPLVQLDIRGWQLPILLTSPPAE